MFPQIPLFVIFANQYIKCQVCTDTRGGSRRQPCQLYQCSDLSSFQVSTNSNIKLTAKNRCVISLLPVCYHLLSVCYHLLSVFIICYQFVITCQQFLITCYQFIITCYRCLISLLSLVIRLISVCYQLLSVCYQFVVSLLSVC